MSRTDETVEASGVMMTRKEAEEFMSAIDAQRKSLVTSITTISRKRWRDSEKAMAVIPYRVRLAAMEKLHEKIGTVFNLCGW